MSKFMKLCGIPLNLKQPGTRCVRSSYEMGKRCHSKDSEENHPEGYNMTYEYESFKRIKTGAANMYERQSNVAFIQIRHQNPQRLFDTWFWEAKNKLMFASTGAIASTSPNGYINNRFMVIRQIVGNIFYVVADSRSEFHKDVNPCVSLSYFWWYKNRYDKTLMRQVRIAGSCEVGDHKMAQNMYHMEPLTRKIQYNIYEPRKVIDWKKKKYEHDIYYNEIITNKISEPEMPKFVNVYEITCQSYEFFQTHKYEIPDRVHFSQDKDGKWTNVRLAP